MAKPAPPECECAFTPNLNAVKRTRIVESILRHGLYTVKKFMDRRLLINVQGNRRVTGLLRGFDIFLNLVLDEARDETVPGREENMQGGLVVIRGNSVASIEVISA